MAVIRPPVWISILFAFIDKSYACSTTACFAKDGCDSFNLTCQGEQKIQITGAEYRYRDNRTIRARDTCCPLNINDCTANYSYNHAVLLFTNCSGRTSCSGKRAPTPTNHECQSYTGDKYIYVSYDCIPDHNILDMCQANRQASEVDIMFHGTFSTTNTTATCVCYVQSQHKIYYELIDVRLFTNVTPDGLYTCLSSNFSINNSLIECQHSSNDRSFKYMNSPDFTGEISTKRELTEIMWLTFTRDAKPEMVWVKLKDKDDDGKSIPLIIGVVVAVIIVIAVVAVTILLLKRRQKLHTEDNTQIYELPNAYTSGHTYAVVETSTYQNIIDNSALTVSDSRT